MQGRAATERTAAVAAARLPAPEHARSPQPRRPASRRQVSRGSCERAGGRGREEGEQSPAGLASQTAWRGRGCHASGARPTGSPRRPLARAERRQPLPSGPEPRSSVRVSVPGVASRRQPRGGKPPSGTAGSRAPLHAPFSTRTGRQGSTASLERFHIQERPTSQMSPPRLRLRADSAWPPRSLGSPGRPVPPGRLAHCLCLPHQRSPGRYGPPLQLAPRVGW